MTARRRNKQHNWFAVTILFLMVSSSLILVFSAISTPSRAADYTEVGVRIGDVAEYKVDYWIVNTPVETLRVIIQNIDGTTVTMNSTYYGPWGTIFSNLETYDIRNPTSTDHNSSEHSFLFPRPLVIAADLMSGDPIYVGANISLNETIAMNFSNATRLVNLANFTGNHIRSSYYWDKQAGLLVELDCSCVILHLTSTTAWDPQTSDISLVSLAVAVVAAPTAVIAAIDLQTRKTG